MARYMSPISNDSLISLCNEIQINDRIDGDDYAKYGVKRGLRNADGTGVMAGLTKICSVDGYYIEDGERVPRPGKLKFRGLDVKEIVEGCRKEDRFGFEEVVWLLIFGALPTPAQLSKFSNVLAECRELPEDFIEDMIMKAPSPNIMNKMARSVMALYSYDDNPDDIATENVLRQCIQLIAQLPSIMSYAYQVKRRHYYKKSMYIHQPKRELCTAQSILRTLRSDRLFTDEEAKLLDLCLILHSEHGGGNNSTFSTRVLTSSGTDTYAAIAAGIGSLKGPKHGGANIKVKEMTTLMAEEIDDITDEKQVADYITKIIRKEAGDRSGLVYGMGHAIYTMSDPRAELLKEAARNFIFSEEFERRFRQLELIEELTPDIFRSIKGDMKPICANVDLYSGLIYDMLGIPEDLFTPLFTVSRMAGWAAHRIEELTTGKRIIRPAYKNVALPYHYIALDKRTDENVKHPDKYIPSEARAVLK